MNTEMIRIRKSALHAAASAVLGAVSLAGITLRCMGYTSLFWAYAIGLFLAVHHAFRAEECRRDEEDGL